MCACTLPTVQHTVACLRHADLYAVRTPHTALHSVALGLGLLRFRASSTSPLEETFPACWSGHTIPLTHEGGNGIPNFSMARELFITFSILHFLPHIYNLLRQQLAGASIENVEATGVPRELDNNGPRGKVFLFIVIAENRIRREQGDVPIFENLFHLLPLDGEMLVHILRVVERAVLVVVFPHPDANTTVLQVLARLFHAQRIPIVQHLRADHIGEIRLNLLAVHINVLEQANLLPLFPIAGHARLLMGHIIDYVKFIRIHHWVLFHSYFWQIDFGKKFINDIPIQWLYSTRFSNYIPLPFP